MQERDRRIRTDSEKEMSFLGDILVALKEKIHTDIQLRPGKNNGFCIPAHRVILASRSKIFKQMLECDPTPDNTITIPEMNSQELESLLEFLYGGSLAQDKMEKHVRSLFHAAHKYEIPYLQECCECHIIDSLNVSNVLEALEISDVFLSQTIKETALEFIIDKMVDITFSAEYEAFAVKNPHLSLEITRAIVNHAKDCMPQPQPQPQAFSSAYEYQFPNTYNAGGWTGSGWTAGGWRTDGSWDPWPN